MSVCGDILNYDFAVEQILSYDVNNVSGENYNVNLKLNNNFML